MREKGDTKDSKGVYLICPIKTEPEMYELVCRSMEERRQWITILRDAISRCSREGILFMDLFVAKDFSIIKPGRHASRR